MHKTVLPSTATKMEKAFDIAAGAQFPYDLPIQKTWSAETCPLDVLPFLAHALSVDVWDSSWPETVKRDVIAASVFVHRHKGTRAAVERALAALDLGVRLSEWFEHGGTPHTFRAEIEVSGRGITEQEIQTISRLIHFSKSAHAHLESLKVYLTSKAPVFIGTACVSGQMIAIQPYVATVPDQNVLAAMGAAVHGHNMITIGAAP